MLIALENYTGNVANGCQEKEMSHRTLIVVCFCLFVLFLGAGRLQADAIIYSPAPEFPGGTVFAQNDVDGFGNFATTYDIFLLDSDTLITGLHWQGGFFNGDHANITAFEITFWADASGQPGSSLLSEMIPGNANQTFGGNQGFWPVYNYSVVLPTCFFAA